MFVLLVAEISSLTLAVVGGSWWFPLIFALGLFVAASRHGRNLRLEEERNAVEVMKREDEAKSLD
jgi:hypothetical protein